MTAFLVFLVGLFVYVFYKVNSNSKVAQPAPQDPQGKFIVVLQRCLQYAAFIFLLFVSFGVATDSIVAGALVAASSLLLLPVVRKKLEGTKFVHPSLSLIAVIFALMVAMAYSDKTVSDAREKKNAQIAEEAQASRQQLLDDFTANPKPKIDEIKNLIAQKNYGGARYQIDIYKQFENAEIAALDEKLAKIEAKINEEAAIQAAKDAEVEMERNAEGSWSVSRDSSKMDDSPSIFVGKDADNSFVAWPGKEGRAHIVARCSENETDFILVTGSGFDVVYGEYDKAAIRYRIDEAKAVRQLWSESTNNESAFAPGAIALLKKLKSAKRLTIEFTPFNSNPAVAEFDMRGFGPHVEEIAKTCKWK